jgi:DNA polymerase I-like protein with 3'-5' exonuclease and polymerase domains
MTFDPGSIVAIDTETTGLLAYGGCRPFAVSMCNQEGDTWYCEWIVDPYTREVYDEGADVEFIRSTMADTSITKVFHNGKFDVRMLDVAFGIKLGGRLEETLFAARACNSLEQSYTLKYLADKYCGITNADALELQECIRRLRSIAAQRSYNLHRDLYADYWLPQWFQSELREEEKSLCERYAVLDAIRTMMLWNMYDRALDIEDVRKPYELELSLWQCTYDMETRGCYVNVDLCKSELQRHKRIILESLTEMRRLSGPIYVKSNRSKGEKAVLVAGDTLAIDWPCKEALLNPRSGKHLEAVICDQRGLHCAELTPSGDPSFSFNSIRAISNDPFVHQLQRYRASHRVSRTFLEKYIDLAVEDHISPGEMCLHPMFNQAGAQTWRYSCSWPNLQQVVNANGARNAVESMSARMAFGPRKGYWWAHADYSQLELYLFAGLAEEHFMLRHMLQGNDLHAECANKAWGGRGNPAALIKGAVALELEAERPTTELVAAMWERFGWQTKWALDVDKKNEFTAWWLDSFGGGNWDIVKAEAALGKKVARTRAKFVMYAKIYGGGWRAINNFLYCGEVEARAFQKEYDDAFPRIKQYLRKRSNDAERDGYIVNAYGYKIVIPPGFSYKSVNYEVQSNAACLLKSAMRKTYKFIHDCMDDWHLLLTIHDELVFEIPVTQDDGLTLRTVQKPDGTTKQFYEVVDNNSDYVFALRNIKAMMEDHEGLFAVPVPVEIARCDQRWDRKVDIKL